MGVPMLRQPQGIARLRPEFARFKGVGAILGASIDDIFGSSARITYLNGPTQAASAHGVARRFEASKSAYALISPPAGVVDFSLAQPFMIVCSFTLAVTTVATRMLSYRQVAASASTNGIQLGYTTNGRLGYWFGNSTGQPAQAASNAAMVAHKPYTVVFGWDGSTHFMFLNGARQTGSSPSSFVTSNNGTTADINIGRRNTGSSYLDGTVSLFAHMTGAFALEEARLLSANPWSMFDDIDSDDDRIMLAAAPVGPINLVGAAGLQANQGGVGKIGQVQNVAGAGGTQANTGGAGAIGQKQNLAGAAGVQTNTGAAGAIDQVQQLAGAPGLQGNEGGADGIGQVQSLTGAGGLQENQGGTGAITVDAQPEPEGLAGAPGAQVNVAGTGAISQVQNLAGAAGQQHNEAGAGAITVDVDPRYSRPDSTIAPGGWRASDGGDLAAAINEPSADATRYIEADMPGARCSTKANAVALPPPGATPVMRYQLWSNTGDGVRVVLLQGAVEIAAWVHEALPAEPTIFAQSLTPQQVAAITDGNALRFDFEAL